MTSQEMGSWKGIFWGGQRYVCFWGIDDISMGDLKVVPVYVLTAVVKGLTFHTVGIFAEKCIC